MNAPGASAARRRLLLSRHGIAAALIGALLLWGAGFAQMEDGRLPPLDQDAVVAALASEAGSSATVERLRSVAIRGALRGAPGQQASPPPSF